MESFVRPRKFNRGIDLLLEISKLKMEQGGRVPRFSPLFVEPLNDVFHDEIQTTIMCFLHCFDIL